MNNNLITDVLIPARSGSKGIPNKNIQLLHGKPLLFHSIDHILNCPNIRYITISSDSKLYLELVKTYYKESSYIDEEFNLKSKIVLLLRPSKISEDLSSDLEVFQHYLEILSKKNINLPDDILHLRPTYPNRNEKYLSSLLTFWYMLRNIYDSCRSVIPISILPIKTYYIEHRTLLQSFEDKRPLVQLVPYFLEWNDKKNNEIILEPYNHARQRFPERSFVHNGCYDIVKTNTILKKNSMTGELILPFEMKEEEDLDIDTFEDFKKNEIL